jgi:GNAT superfamily N-acetyltransferase
MGGRTVDINAPQRHQLRRATLADAAVIADLFLASRRAAMPWLPVLHGREATVTFFRDVVPARAEVWIEIAAGGELAGFIAFGGGEIEHLYVAPDLQRQGTGSRLLRLAQARGEPSSCGSSAATPRRGRSTSATDSGRCARPTGLPTRSGSLTSATGGSRRSAERAGGLRDMREDPIFGWLRRAARWTEGCIHRSQFALENERNTVLTKSRRYCSVAEAPKSRRRGFLAVATQGYCCSAQLDQPRHRGLIAAAVPLRGSRPASLALGCRRLHAR